MVDRIVSNKESYGHLPTSPQTTYTSAIDSALFEFPLALVSMGPYGSSLAYYDGKRTRPMFNNNSPITSEYATVTEGEGRNLLWSLKYSESSNAGRLRVYEISYDDIISSRFNPGIRKVRTLSFPSPLAQYSSEAQFSVQRIPSLGSEVFFILGGSACLLVDVAGNSVSTLVGSLSNKFIASKLNCDVNAVLLARESGDMQVFQLELGKEVYATATISGYGAVPDYGNLFYGMYPTPTGWETYYGEFEHPTYRSATEEITVSLTGAQAVTCEFPTGGTPPPAVITASYPLVVSKKLEICSGGGTNLTWVLPDFFDTITSVDSWSWGPYGSYTDIGGGQYLAKGIWANRTTLITEATISVHHTLTQHSHKYNSIHIPLTYGVGEGSFFRAALVRTRGDTAYPFNPLTGSSTVGEFYWGYIHHVISIPIDGSLYDITGKNKEWIYSLRRFAPDMGDPIYTPYVNKAIDEDVYKIKDFRDSLSIGGGSEIYPYGRPLQLNSEIEGKKLFAYRPQSSASYSTISSIKSGELRCVYPYLSPSRVIYGIAPIINPNL